MTVQPGEEKAQGNLTNVYIKTWRESKDSAKKAESGLSQWCHEMGPESMGPNWNTGGSPKHQETLFFFYFWVLLSTGTSCQRSCWVSMHGDAQKPSGHGPGHWLDQWCWPRWPPEVPSSPTIVWLCEMQCGICYAYFRWITGLPNEANCFF